MFHGIMECAVLFPLHGDVPQCQVRRVDHIKTRSRVAGGLASIAQLAVCFYRQRPCYMAQVLMFLAGIAKPRATLSHPLLCHAMLMVIAFSLQSLSV